MKNKTRTITVSAMIAAIYTVLTLLCAQLGLASGAIQLRVSEALCVLPVFTSAAIPGVTLGCLLSNLLVGGTVYDIVFGTLATLIGAVIARLMRRMRYLAFLPTVISNMMIIPAVLIFSGVGGGESFPLLALTVGIGEVLSCGLFGALLILTLDRQPRLCTAIFGDRS